MVTPRLFGITKTHNQGSNASVDYSILMDRNNGRALDCLYLDWSEEAVLVVFAPNGQAPGIGQSHGRRVCA